MTDTQTRQTPDHEAFAAATTFSEQVAAAYGVTVPDLYMQVTGQPVWLDAVHPDARRASRKWSAFLADCEARLAAVSA